MMTSSTVYKAGDDVLVRLRFTSESGAKRRPAVILSVPAYHASRADAVMMPLSTQANRYFGDAPLRDWAAAGLPRPTNIKAVIQTIDRRVIDERIGSLSNADFQNVRD